MTLIPGEKIVLRRRGPWGEWPWVITDRSGEALHAGMDPDAGWQVHDAGDGVVMLESLTVPTSRKSRWLCGKPGDLQVVLAPSTLKDATGLRWRVHPGASGMFLLECLSQKAGPKWLAVRGFRGTLTDRPAGRSVEHELVALPLADCEALVTAEKGGDYSFMVPYGMTTDGGLPDIPPPAAPELPPGTLTPDTPRTRAGDDLVALELIAALQPSFDDGEGGAENSDYTPDDPRRIGWPHNIMSLETIATPTGIVRLEGSPDAHEPPPGELARCRKLARELVAALGDLLPFGGDSPTPFRPFYLVIGQGEPAARRLTPALVRDAFRGTIFPDTPIALRPFTDPDFADRDGGAWGGFLAWAARQADLAELSYVEVGYDTCQEPNYAAVFPRLILGLTKAGSLAGACGTIVQA